jgi:hypothetical protein
VLAAIWKELKIGQRPNALVDSVPKNTGLLRAAVKTFDMFARVNLPLFDAPLSQQIMRPS